MNRGLLRLSVVGLGSLLGSYAFLDTIATAGLASASRKKFVDVSLKAERKTMRPIILRNSFFLALTITGIVAATTTVRH